MQEISMQDMLARMRALADQAAGLPARPPAEGGQDFAVLLRTAIEQVNGLQQEAGRLAEAFELGAPGVGLADVMVASQKARIAFEAVTQVRNRLVSAYQEIMNMPI